MKDDNKLKQIQDAINALPADFSILEEQIDIELQMAYFDLAKDYRSEATDSSLIAKAKEELYSQEVDFEDKKLLLVKLAGLDDVEAFRLIESFHQQAEGEIKDWAVLALQESRMIIQSSLMGEQQVFISTGLGGRGQNIRYFAAMMHAEYGEVFTKTQKKLVASEFRFFLNESEGELEEINFKGSFIMGVFLFPLKKDLHTIFKSFIDECNNYGNFLNEDVIITNVKKLTVRELKKFINKG